MTVPPRSIPIIVLAGQSNANSGGIGQAIFSEVTAEHGIFIHTAVNGTSISPGLDAGGGDWSASGAPGSGELLHSLMAQIAAMLDPHSPSYVPGAYLDKVIWVQGEADSWWSGAAANYQKELAAIHQTMTDRFGSHDLVISALSDAAITGTNTTESHIRNWATIQRAQLALAAQDSTVHVIDPDSVAAAGGFSLAEMLNADHIHYNSASGYAQALGQALVGSDSFSALSSTVPHYATGTLADDRLALTATGLGQAYGCSGFDTLTLTGRSAGVTVFGAGLDANRIVANGGSAFLLDLVAIEALVLPGGADIVTMAGQLVSIDTGGGDDRVTGLTKNDRIALGLGNDLASGGSGNDSLYGGDGFDYLYGGLGNDLVSGESYADKLYGGDGNDRLLGGTGNDLLTGGSGRDAFVFAATAGSDRILDFVNGTDRIEIQGARFGDLQITGSGADTLIRFGSVSITLTGINHTLIDGSDFLFS